jgi:hypothetical protein
VADTGAVGNAVLLVVALLLPTALGFAALGTARAVRWWTQRRGQPVPPEPIEKLCAAVRRLHAQLEALENQPASPGKAVRVRALRAAYLDALCAACGRLDVAAPTGNPVRQAEIYRVEADLRRRGLDVRPAVP